MTLRRYLLVRTGWAAGMLFAFVSIAYLVVWVAGNYRGDSGYGSFLWGALTGSLGELPARPPSERVSVSSLVWHASGVTLSLLLFTAAFTAVVACLLALVARGRRPALAAVRGFEFLGEPRCCRSGRGSTSPSTSATRPACCTPRATARCSRRPQATATARSSGPRTSSGPRSR